MEGLLLNFYTLNLCRRYTVFIMIIIFQHPILALYLCWDTAQTAVCKFRLRKSMMKGLKNGKRKMFEISLVTVI